MKVVIVGGVAGGATAAARLRRLDERMEIVLIERTGFVSYANCGLPYYIGGVIEDEGELTLQTPGGFRRRFGIDVRTKSEVTRILPDEKKVVVRDNTNGREYTETYDKLLLSPGAKAIRPRLPGIDSGRVFTLRTVEDTLGLDKYIKDNAVRSAVVVGGGYIGIEAAENLVRRGISVTVVQREDQLMLPLDYDMATLVHAEMREKGVRLLTGRTVTGFRETEGGISAQTDGFDDVTADMVLLAVGVSPDASLAKEAGIRLGLRGAIAVNDRMETSVPDIYAVGDAVSVTHRVTGQESLISLAGPANKQGRIAADNIAGLDSRYGGSLGSSVIRVFDLTVASTGISCRAARESGIDADSVVLSPSSHAGYYPGATAISIKLVFEKETYRILGAQLIGREGVDKRCDVIATAMQLGCRADKLKDLDLAYAPPYSSAKDPVNMAGFIVDNIAQGLVRLFHWDDVARLPRDGSVVLLDARTPAEYARGHAEGFVNIPLDELRGRMGEIARGKKVYVMCQSGLRSYLACRILSQHGYECVNFSGGYRFYAAVTREEALARAAYPCGMDKMNEAGAGR